MAIQFARIELVGRNKGGNACRKGAYNARLIIKDNRTNITFNFKNKGDNVYHEILLPEAVNKKFKLSAELMNEIERVETRKNSSLLKDIVIALPDDKELNLQDRINITHRVIEEMQWVKEGLPVQIDIHQPHDGEKNWHAHILLPKRRFAECGEKLGAKARDLDIQIRGGKNPYGFAEDKMIHEKVKDVINNYFKELGLENRVDGISLNPEEHIGPVRMRSVFNGAAKRNEERREAEIEHLKSGKEVLEKVTRHMSVFTAQDIRSAVKCIINKAVRDRLVEDALSDKSVLALYDREEKQTKYFTTREVRYEEKKILRLSGYVGNIENVVLQDKKNGQVAKDLIEAAGPDLTEEQHKALAEMLLGNSGLRVLRGRAGVGKSYVLGKVNSIASSSGTNVIGVAPTHRARLELASCGFERVDTVKGMLFKLANGRFDLPKGSLLVLDEAGMVGNDDYIELLRVAATRKCNVILSGDERQLASVARGGMFEVFAVKYGSSSIFDIQRQDSSWGRDVAMYMSTGHTGSAISILERENRIKWEADAEASMSSLLKGWNESQYSIENRLILAVKNKDVAALNHGARQYLKLAGKLTGDEIAVSGNHYMSGDRILITKTNKDLGLINGEIAELVDASENKFTIRTESDRSEDSREISFNPSEYSSFRHGYATTIFKAQGASVRDVYVYHDGFAGIRNSYVALSRNVSELNLYANRSSTLNVDSLIRQLSWDVESGNSLGYLTDSEVEFRRAGNRLANDKSAFFRGLNSLIDFVGETANKIVDKYIPNSEYYNYKEPSAKYESVERVIDRTYSELEERKVVGDEIHSVADMLVPSDENKGKIVENSYLPSNNNLNTVLSRKGVSSNYKETRADAGRVVGNSGEVSGRKSAKNRFYANADRVRAARDYVAQKEEWSRDYEQLKSEVKFKAEAIVRNLLGDPNKRLSNSRELRYGDHGKLAVRITGEKAGTWYDFARGEGGDLFGLVRETRSCSFKESANYLRQQVGMSISSSKYASRENIRLVKSNIEKDRLQDLDKQRREEEKQNKAKAIYVDKLYARSKDIGERSVAWRYLSKTRGIDIDVSSDIKTAGIYDKQEKRYMPALIAFARNKEGDITGGQQIILNSKTLDKAEISVPKRSFGKISSSFVDLGYIGDNSKKSEITIIAEGIETGLSVKQALREHSEIGKEITKIEVLCSLGINNIKNYDASPGEKIIIAADNDKVSVDENIPVTAKTIEIAQKELESKGAFVEVACPSIEGDFNDLLKSAGERSIIDEFKPAINCHMAKSLGEYIVSSRKNELPELDKEYEVYLASVEKYNLNQEKILNAWRIEPNKGRRELETVYNKIVSAEESLDGLKPMLDLAKTYNIPVDSSKIITSLVNSKLEYVKPSMDVLAKKAGLEQILSGFDYQKHSAEKIGEVFNVIKREDKFLSEVEIESRKDLNLDRKLSERLELSKNGKSEDIISSIKQNLESNYKQGVISYADLVSKMLSSGYDIKSLNTELSSLAVNARSKYLESISIELNELKRLGSFYDEDRLVGILKSMSEEEREKYGDKLLGDAAKHHIEPILNQYEKDRNNANNFWQFLDVVAKEQEVHRELYKNHPFAIRSLDRKNGDLKYSTITSYACQIGSRSSTESVISMLRYAAKNNIVSKNRIMKEVNKNSGNLNSIHNEVKVMCEDYKSRRSKISKEKSQEQSQERSQEQEKIKEIKIDKGRGLSM